MATKPELLKTLKEILCAEKEDKCNQENTRKNKFYKTRRLANED
jgi:hypothetical protein